MIELSERLRAILVRSEMGFTERFDADAERFYRETGFMAPGKSQPLEMPSNDEAREAAWNRFNKQLRSEFHQALRDAITTIEAAS